MVEGLLTGLLGAAAAVVLLFLGKELVLPTTIGRLDAGKDVNAIAFEYTAVLVLDARAAARRRRFLASPCAASCASDRRARPSEASSSWASRTSCPGHRSRSTAKGWATLGRRSRRRQQGRGRARVERVIGPAKRIEDVLEALAGRRGPARGLRAARRARAEPRGPNRPPRAARRSRSTPRRRRTSTTRSRCAARATASASGCTSRTSPTSSRRAPRSTAAPSSAGTPSTCPGLVAPMLPHELADEACSLRPNEDRLDADRRVRTGAATPSFHRSVIRSRERFTYGQVAADPRGQGAARAR